MLSTDGAACVTGVPLRQVHRIIDVGLLGSAAHALINSVLPDEAVLCNPDWVAPVLFVLRLLRWFGLVECRGDDATRRGHGMWRKTPLFERFVQFDPELVGTGHVTLH